MNKKIKSKYLQEFIKEIQFKNRNPQSIKALELLNDIKIELDRIKNNWNLYSPPINTEERQGHRVLRLIPKRQDNGIDT